MIDPKSLAKDRIQAWLDQYHGGDRNWLASKTGNSPGTVAHWFSSRGFSDAALASIAALMELDGQRASRAGDDDTGTIPLTTAEFELIEQARALVGNPPRRQFYRDAIIKYVQEIRQQETAFAGDGDMGKHLKKAAGAFVAANPPVEDPPSEFAPQDQGTGRGLRHTKRNPSRPSNTPTEMR